MRAGNVKRHYSADLMFSLRALNKSS